MVHKRNKECTVNCNCKDCITPVCYGCKYCQFYLDISNRSLSAMKCIDYISLSKLKFKKLIEHGV